MNTYLEKREMKETKKNIQFPYRLPVMTMSDKGQLKGRKVYLGLKSEQI